MFQKAPYNVKILGHYKLYTNLILAYIAIGPILYALLFVNSIYFISPQGMRIISSHVDKLK